MNHPDVVEANKRPVGPDGHVVVVPWVHGQTLGLNQLTAELCQVDQYLRAFTALPQIILSVANVVNTTLNKHLQQLSSEAMTLLSGTWPDGSILCSTPEGVGPHGSCGDAFDSVGVVRKHVDGFLHWQIMHMDLCVSCTRYQNSVSRVRKELH